MEINVECLTEFIYRVVYVTMLYYAFICGDNNILFLKVGQVVCNTWVFKKYFLTFVINVSVKCPSVSIFRKIARSEVLLLVSVVSLIGRSLRYMRWNWKSFKKTENYSLHTGTGDTSCQVRTHVHLFLFPMDTAYLRPWQMLCISIYSH